MTAKKLTQADKAEILKLYRNPEETTSTLARRYDVSHSTISRLLKSTLSPDDYETLIQQKRSMRPHTSIAEAEESIDTDLSEQSQAELSLSTARRLRKRSSAGFSSLTEAEEAEEAEEILPLLNVPAARASSAEDDLLDEAYSTEASTIKEMLGEDLLDNEEDLADLDEDEDDLEDLEDLEDSDEDDLDEEILLPKRRVPSNALVQVLPLSEASFPKPCYLVVDRAAELITRPLKDFGDLGQIPKEEVQQRTLPVFDNHRVARRFSNRAQRVIKVPDGKMLQKASPYLKAKGITRLLIDGQVYSLSTT
ncbi:transposase [Planktothrix sp. FACHB-1355]|uniref:Transposase n=1 Tax=Aerosakkonema funiforme FACHB-1375 TaxID=2949571 RepID=A0A926VEH8_9CYAN|nr:MULTISPECIES: transposase [Oscillatoriales]MBD2182263.1 transposase [Aerosakkonema funiforme FACHB-1375]MBD3558061.1 transposase [Planktothrix sp. FACHB-1355]